MSKGFKHKMAAHCESGTVSALLSHNGLKISEPMIFGISSGIFFAYLNLPNLPFPTFIVRSKPGAIRENTAKMLGIKYKKFKFKNKEKAKSTLDELIKNKIPVGTQVDFFYMNYLPPHVRVHINMHFVIVLNKQNEQYTVSDCYSPRLEKISGADFIKGRFPGGSFSPKGFMFYPESLPEKVDLKIPIIKGIKKACFNMLKIPVPFIGVSGIKTFAKKVVTWPKLARNIEHLSHEIMKINVLLEDQGTGGAGFRYMYATFLREASEILKNPGILEMSKRIMEIGDKWREISLFAAKIGKKRELGDTKLGELSNMIMERANDEKKFFIDLYKLVK